MPTISEEADARSRAAMIADLALRLEAAGHGELIERISERIGNAKAPKELDAVSEAAEAILSGRAAPKPATKSAKGAPSMVVTFGDIARRWTSGELAREYRDHIREKRSAGHDRLRLERYFYPLVGDAPIASFTLDHAEAVMRAMPERRTPATRRHVAQLLHRVLSLAVFPLRLIGANPLPKGFLPKVGPGRAKGWLYPDEDAQLCASPAVPLCWRVFYGFLNREGLRTSEAAALTWSDFDLQRGAITLDENETDDPRAWALSPGCVAALRVWRGLREAAGLAREDDWVFVDEEDGNVKEVHLAERFRRHLQAAGIKRATLFERSASRQPIRIHDTRATFITVALANGRSEAWVQDRTGHKSSIMINRYRRAARSVAELGLGELRSLAEAVPELARKIPPGEPAGDATPGERVGQPTPDERKSERKSERRRGSGQSAARNVAKTDTWPCGGMVDAGDLKSLTREGVPVRVRPGLLGEIIGEIVAPFRGRLLRSMGVPPFPPPFPPAVSSRAANSGMAS